MNLPKVILTEDQIREKQSRYQELAQTIIMATEEQSKISRWLEAVSVVMGEDLIPSRESEGALEDNESERPREPLIDAVARIVSDSPNPLRRRRLKDRLAEEGYSGKSLGNYFYTVLARLQKKGKVVLLDDGRVGRPS